MQPELFVEEITKFAQERDFTVYTKEMSLRIEGLWITIILTFTRDEFVFVYLHSRLTSGYMPGDRTDANELFPMLLAIFLRAGTRNASCELIDIPHPVEGIRETEVYARFLILNQPNGSVFSLTEDNLQKVKDLLLSIRIFLGSFFEILEVDNPDDVYSGEVIVDEKVESWARSVARSIDEPYDGEFTEFIVDKKVQFVRRLIPAWLHYRSIRSHVTVYHSPKLARSLVDFVVQGTSPWQILQGVNSTLYITNGNGNIYNAVSDHYFAKAKRILKKLNQPENENEMICIPLENYLVVAAGEYTVFIKADCGKRKFEGEKSKVRKRHEKEIHILFPVDEFIWCNNINDERFELFVLELLNRDNSVTWARKVSGSNEPDGGRGIICEWNIVPNEHEIREGNVVYQERLDFSSRRVIVQCKAYKGAVGKSKVQDIRDTVEHYNARGYLLVVSSYLARSLTEHLENLRTEGKIWVDWWTRTEIEERLSQNRDLIAKYSDIVQIKSQ